MTRPREFDETAALDAALECFWQRGYEATSVRDLAASMGLTAPSLYNAFGDKQQLFARALERYLHCTTRDRLRRLERSLPPKEAITEIFAEIVEHSITDRKRKGCFLVNSALEMAPHDGELGMMVADQFSDIEAFFKRMVLAGQADGTVPRRLSARDMARMLLGLLLGLRVLARTMPDRALLEGTARPALALLEMPRRKRNPKK
jgi:TetR/AcrR family transcriptional repressor of nem operon